MKKRLAESAGCQQAYFSQVLAGDSHLTPEQAERLCIYWALPELEAEYFFTLVLEGRAGTTSLQNFLRKKREEIRRNARKETFQKPALQAPEWAAKYYSHWLYSAVHVLLSIPTFRSAPKLAAHLHQPVERIENVLRSLADMQLAQVSEGLWTLTTATLYAGDRGTNADLHHRNWRTFAAGIPGEQKPGDLRYTCIHTLSEKDFVIVREMLHELIQKSRNLLEPSPEEIGACLMIDWIEI